MMADKCSDNGQLGRAFYQTVDRESVYSSGCDPSKHPFYPLLNQFIDKWELGTQRCLEIGSAKGVFQDLVSDYTGVDVADSLSIYYHKKFIPVFDAKLPFPDSSFDAIFSYATHEHIPDLETALEEIVRVLKPGGVCLFAPAWHTRSWFSQGYQVRPYSEFKWKGKIIKLTIPLLDFVLIRWPFVICRRVLRLCEHLLAREQPRPLKYKRLKPNYETYLQSDSDACNSLDPFDVIVWFKSRGFICHGYENLGRALFIRSLALELQKPVCR